MNSIAGLLLLLAFPAAAAGPDTTNLGRQPVFKVGGREQRVRIFLTHLTNMQALILGSPEMALLSNDPAREDLGNAFFANAIAPAKPPLLLGTLAQGNDHFGGLVANFPLLSCAMDSVLAIKRAGDANPDLTVGLAEVNLFLEPVDSALAHDVQMRIGPVAGTGRTQDNGALNVSIAFDARSGECGLPVDQQIQTTWTNEQNAMFDRVFASTPTQNIPPFQNRPEASSGNSQPVFGIAGHELRIRYSVANAQLTSELLDPPSPQMLVFLNDPIAHRTGKFGNLTLPPAQAGLADFAGGNGSDAGLDVNVDLVECGLALTRQILKAVSNTPLSQRVHELNIVLLPVHRPQPESVLEVQKSAQALSVLIEFDAPTSSCRLPTQSQLQAQIGR